MPHSPPGGKDKIMFRRRLFPGVSGDCFDETVPSGGEPAFPGKATLISSTAFSGVLLGIAVGTHWKIVFHAERCISCPLPGFVHVSGK